MSSQNQVPAETQLSEFQHNAPDTSDAAASSSDTRVELAQSSTGANEDDHISSSSNSQISSPTALMADNDDPEKYPAEDGLAGYQPESRLSRAESYSNLSRTYSRALTNADFIESELQKDNSPLPAMGLDKVIPNFIPPKDEYTVSFNGPDDPLHPHNWPVKKKLVMCLMIGFNTLSVTWGSSIFSTATTDVARVFHVGDEVGILGTSLYVLGFATGPVVWAPLSELYGRRVVLILSILGFTLFQFAVATGKDIQTVIICRAFAGCIGAAPLVVVPASFADLFDNATRGKLITIFTMTVFTTPIIAPVAGAFIVNSYLGWRWTAYITGIIGSLAFVMVTFFYKETHHPIILVEKLNYLRRRTGNWAIHAPHDEFSLSFREIVEKNISRPIIMLFSEPIIFLITFYNAFIYGILYLLLSLYPIVFLEGYGMKGGVAELPYLGVALGMVFGGFYSIWAERSYLRALKANDGKSVPEARLITMFPGAFTFPIGLFWFTWTGNYHKTVHWMLPTAAGVFIGFGFISIFNGSINYIIDSYLVFAASAMAANAFLRALWACAFPLFGTQMFHGMGTNWAGLLLACVGFVLLPVPFLFHKYGKRIRKKSKYAFDLS